MKRIDEIFINQILQEIKAQSEGVEWFRKFDVKGKHDIIRFIDNMIIQAKANDSDVDSAIINSGLKSTYTPCVLLKKGLNEHMVKILNLPSSEYEKSFLLLINLLKIADERRRQKDCRGKCDHWWHKDLSDSIYLEKLIKEN